MNLLEEVRKEAALLREHATKEERSRLDFRLLNAWDVSKCVYGQITGDCRSNRAEELLNKCATPVSKTLFKIVDGAYSFRGKGKGFSAIEFYISQHTANKWGLIDYLQDKTNTLEL